MMIYILLIIIIILQIINIIGTARINEVFDAYIDTIYRIIKKS